MKSRLAEELREKQLIALRKMTREDRLRAFLAHSSTVAHLYSAGVMLRRSKRSGK